MRASPFHEMDRLFEQLRRSMDHRLMASVDGAGTAHVNVETADDHYLVHADLPGFEREEIDLRFQDDRLTIEASHGDDDVGAYRRRRVRDWLNVPGPVDVDGIEAEYHNGVLEVRLPRDLRTRTAATGSTSTEGDGPTSRADRRAVALR